MNSLELKIFMETNRHTKPHFLGIFSCDTLPRKRVQTRPALIICNTDEHYKPGQHWIAIYLLDENTIEYFDSFGMYPSNLYINLFIRENCNVMVSNNTIIQGLFSKYCGHYCALFLYCRCRGISMKNFLSIFEYPDLMKNDEIVRKMFGKIYCKTTRKANDKSRKLKKFVPTMKPICEEIF